MKRIEAPILGVACALILLLAQAQPTHAGTFVMKQCQSASNVDFSALFGLINGSAKVDPLYGCSVSTPDRFGLYQDRSGGKFANGEGGQFYWRTPFGARIAKSKFSARLKDANYILAELLGSNGTALVDLDGGVVHDGSQQVSQWANPSRPQTTIIARLICLKVGGCANAPTSPKAYLQVTDAEFEVEDILPPTIAPSGPIWEWGQEAQYHRGSWPIKIDASDQGSGIVGAWAEVNGLKVPFPAADCPGDKGSFSSRFTPCPLTYTATKSFNTSAPPFREGANSLRLCVRDYAGSEAAANVSCSAARTVLIDSKPPEPPIGFGSSQGPGWQPDNGFDLSWSVPGGQVAPVIGAAYEIRDLETDELEGSGYFEGGGEHGTGRIELPRVGAFEVSLFLVDQGLNGSGPAKTVVRFDDHPPGDIEPEPAAGWVSRDELPISQGIEQAEPGGPSGISGYALAVSQQGPIWPCGAPVCLDSEITLSGGAEQRTGTVGGLSEGAHWISAVAVSGARRSSMEPGSTLVNVDRTAPTSTIEGVPDEWVDHPVTLTVRASDGLSGMSARAGDDGDPKVVIAADNYAPYESPGPSGTFSIATEGINRVRYWAEDLAGNANDGLASPDGDLHPSPGYAVVRIDTTAPSARFDPDRDPEDPELVRAQAEDADSGVASVAVGIRRTGTGARFKSLPTTGRDGRYEARVPSDDLVAGAYELNVTARDRAGNESTGSSTSGGDPMILELPLKSPTSLVTSFGRGRRVATAGYGVKRPVTGRLTGNGEALPNQPVQVVETFAAGSRRPAITRTVRTDGAGRFRIGFAPGPGRSVQARFDGTRRLARSSGPRMTLRVRGRVSLRMEPKALYNGGLARMQGKVGHRGALVPARGKLVAIQYLDPARRSWRPVEVLRTDRRGRFRYRYRFRTIGTAQRIVFRANLLPEAGWPYLTSTSRPRSVIVYPKEQIGR